MSAVMQKSATREIPKIRQSARGENCTMEGPMCNFNPETTVWCHSDYSEHGRGFGFKTHDIFGYFGCFGCNSWFDEHSKRTGSKFYVEPQERRWYYQRAHDRSLVRLLEKGVLK